VPRIILNEPGIRVLIGEGAAIIPELAIYSSNGHGRASAMVRLSRTRFEPSTHVGHDIFGLQPPRAISRCDQIYGPFIVKHRKVALVALTHPALYFANVARRRFGDHTGIEAERAMVQAAKALMIER
jgi:hypothetical protein